jgi:hypothetical protein
MRVKSFWYLPNFISGDSGWTLCSGDRCALGCELSVGLCGWDWCGLSGLLWKMREGFIYLCLLDKDVAVSLGQRRADVILRLGETDRTGQKKTGDVTRPLATSPGDPTVETHRSGTFWSHPYICSSYSSWRPPSPPHAMARLERFLLQITCYVSKGLSHSNSFQHVSLIYRWTLWGDESTTHPGWIQHR